MAIEEELAQYGSCDPAKVEEKRRATQLAHEAALRWTGEFLFLYLSIYTSIFYMIYF